MEFPREVDVKIGSGSAILETATRFVLSECHGCDEMVRRETKHIGSRIMQCAELEADGRMPSELHLIVIIKFVGGAGWVAKLADLKKSNVEA
jgi:hypothetical protein